MSLEKYHYIVVEGPIGAGKTSLAKRLAERLRANLLPEEAGENPFLSRFYQEGKRHALSTQLFFLFQRLNQVRDLTQLDLFSRPTVADFMLEKDPLFARLTLDDDEYRLYRQIYAHLKPQAPAPDLVIYLQAPAEVLMERVKKRGIDYERSIREDYLAKLADSYARYFYQYEASPLLIVNSANLNFVDSNEDFELLLARMAGLRGGREFFNRAG